MPGKNWKKPEKKGNAKMNTLIDEYRRMYEAGELPEEAGFKAEDFSLVHELGHDPFTWIKYALEYGFMTGYKFAEARRER